MLGAGGGGKDVPATGGSGGGLEVPVSQALQERPPESGVGERESAAHREDWLLPLPPGEVGPGSQPSG